MIAHTDRPANYTTGGRVVQDCHKVPKLSLGYPRNQGCPRDILDTRPIVGLPLRFRGSLVPRISPQKRGGVRREPGDEARFRGVLNLP